MQIYVCVYFDFDFFFHKRARKITSTLKTTKKIMVTLNIEKYIE